MGSSYDGDLSLPLGLTLGSPIFPSSCEGKLGVALESLQGPRHLIQACVWAQPAKRDELRDVGSKEKKDHIEVVDGTAQHFFAEKIKSWEHLIDGEEPFVPPAEPCEVV